jgi:multidrug efflux pump subunit AcrA (membrane-fusion protein)
VTIILDLHAETAGVLIPRSALDGDASGPGRRDARVEVMENGKGSWRSVTVGDARGENVEILEGLRPGERVVIRNRAEGAGEERR